MVTIVNYLADGESAPCCSVEAYKKISGLFQDPKTFSRTLKS